MVAEKREKDNTFNTFWVGNSIILKSTCLLMWQIADCTIHMLLGVGSHGFVYA
jgi:hypothetical protein